MSIRDRTNPRNRVPRKLGTNPTSLDGNYGPTTLPGPRPVPVPAPAPAPVTGRPVNPLPLPVPAPGRPVNPTPLPVPAPGGFTRPTNPTPLPVPPGPNVPPPNMGQLPGTGVPGQPLPPGFGLDFMRNVTPNELVNNQLNALLQSNSPYIQNARQRGAEYAASRGNLNSSIGAGAAERSALEAAMPIAQADAQVYRDANAANFDSLAQLRQMRTAGDIENWLSDQTFNREYNGRLALMPIQSSLDMMAYIAQRAMEDPAVYTPDVMSGFQNFFQGNLFNIMQNWFGEQPAGGG